MNVGTVGKKKHILSLSECIKKIIPYGDSCSHMKQFVWFYVFNHRNLGFQNSEEAYHKGDAAYILLLHFSDAHHARCHW